MFGILKLLVLSAENGTKNKLSGDNDNPKKVPSDANAILWGSREDTE